VLEDNPGARRLYETSGWTTDAGRKCIDAGGTETPIVRYRKRLS
jgi:hypothetical protein